MKRYHVNMELVKQYLVDSEDETPWFIDGDWSEVDTCELMRHVFEVETGPDGKHNTLDAEDESFIWYCVAYRGKAPDGELSLFEVYAGPDPRAARASYYKWKDRVLSPASTVSEAIWHGFKINDESSYLFEYVARQ